MGVAEQSNPLALTIAIINQLHTTNNFPEKPSARRPPSIISPRFLSHAQRCGVKVAQEEWEKLPWKRTYEIIDGTPRRVEAVITAEGENEVLM